MHVLESLYARPIQWSLRIRFASVFLIAGFCWFVERSTEENVSMAIVIILGLVHYFFSYLYRFRSKGHEKSQYSSALIAFSLLIALAFFLPLEVFIGIVAAYFVVHFLLDEAFLSNERVGYYGWLRMAPTVVLYWFYYAFYLTNSDMVWAQFFAYFSALIFGGWLILSAVKGLRWGLIDYHYASIYIVSYLFVMSGISLHGKALFEPLNFLVISHVVNWYFHKWIKIGSKGERVAPFLREVFWINILAAFLFVAYYSFRDDGLGAIDFLGFFFQPIFFYIWSILHFISSVRFSDFRGSAA